MSRLDSLQVETEGTGISVPLSEQINLLGGLLGRVISEQAGQPMLDLIEELRGYAKQAVQTGDVNLLERGAERMAELDLDEISWLLRAFTAYFHLVNQAEQQEITRINRERAVQSAEGQPRADSIDEAVYYLKQRGLSLEQVVEVIGKLDIQPTLTAHPTEARRRSILYKQKQIADTLTHLRQCTSTPEEVETALADIRNQISLLLATDEVRAERLTVQDEVEHGLYFLGNAIWQTLPRIYDDLARSVRRYYGQAPVLPAFLKFRSWIGGDRDGNPNVTPAVTRETFLRQREVALDLLIRELRELRRELSISARQAPVPPELTASLEHDAALGLLGELPSRQFQREPYRLKASYMLARLELLLEETRRQILHTDGERYTCSDFVQDLELLRQSLEASGFGTVAHESRLAKLITLARSFGFHMAAMDVRQHSNVHEQAVASLLRVSGVHEDYASLGEEERVRLLSAELENPRPLIPRGAALPDLTRELLGTMEVIGEILRIDPDAIRCYIVSMTHSVSDMLEVLLVAKESGLWRITDGRVETPLDVVPLFETIEDLHEAEARMEALFTSGIYRKHLAGREDFQEIMLGYSDSNKDGGYWMANWALHQALESLGGVCRRHDVDFRLFHGRGGTVGRGGGRANQAILAMPSVAHNGRIRFTEQGEVISFRYALPDIARRHLEQIVNAMLQSTATPLTSDGSPAGFTPEQARLMDEVAARSMRSYRDLIDDEHLWPWYTQVTPIEQISRLPIASRPVSRKSAHEVDFNSLRAIPWNFAWTQVRYMVPGWYGIGNALSDVMREQPGAEAALAEAYKSWHFFRAVVNNAQREMARARFEIARYYAALAPKKGHPGFHGRIASEFERAQEALLRITGQAALLDNNRLIQKSIRLRNPYTDVLNLLQVELLKRYRAAAETDREPLRQALFLSINGIAAAVQSTG